jgi:basic amino acid/polyamine antiporter, APA family
MAVLVLRKTDPNRVRPFRTPYVRIMAPLSAIGCLGLFISLSWHTIMTFLIWTALGLALYFGYGRKRSTVMQARKA